MKEQNHKRLKNMERMLLPMLCLLMMAVGCKNKNQTPTEPESDSTAVTEKAELTTKKDEPPRPLFLYHLSTDYMTMVYWDEELQAERARIEKQLKDFQNGLWSEADAQQESQDKAKDNASDKKQKEPRQPREKKEKAPRAPRQSSSGGERLSVH